MFWNVLFLLLLDTSNTEDNYIVEADNGLWYTAVLSKECKISSSLFDQHKFAGADFVLLQNEKVMNICTCSLCHVDQYYPLALTL